MRLAIKTGLRAGVVKKQRELTRAAWGERPCRILTIALAASLSCSFMLWAQNSDCRTSEKQDSWTITTQTHTENVNPTRVSERHTRNGKCNVDEQSVEVAGSAGHFEPYQDITTETIQVDVNTVRTTTRAFARDINGAKTMVQVTEEEKRLLPQGNSKVSRSISRPDSNGKLQEASREIEETKHISDDVEETKTTLMLPNSSGVLAPVKTSEERRQRNADQSIDSQKSTFLLDGGGKWQISEKRQAHSRREGNDLSTEEHVLRPDDSGRLEEVSRVKSKEIEVAPGERSRTIETYSVDVPGWARDRNLHLVERVSTRVYTSQDGRQTSEEKLEQTNPGDPVSGPRVTAVTTENLRPDGAGAEVTRTTLVRNPSGNFAPISVSRGKSDSFQAIRIQGTYSITGR